MKKQKGNWWIMTLDGLYKRKCDNHDEAIMLQNESKGKYYLGLISWS